MKIGVITSGNDTISLRSIFTRYDHEYLIYHDQLSFPFCQKNFDFITKKLNDDIDFLTSKGAETIIVDPIYELALRENHFILPLFQTYLRNEVLPHSLVGKLGILADIGSQNAVQEILQNSLAQYQPSQAQKSIKKFNFPFLYWIKSPKARDRGISDLGIHNPYLIKTLKNDLRYFKDANVDSFIPLHYHYFQMQKTIKSFFNSHKTRFFDLSFIEKSFKNLTLNSKNSTYNVQIFTNQSCDFVTSNRHLMWLMERGKESKVIINEI
ncbi:hypothetical protein AGMMS50249_1740 [candidate division SR1 bacterium]|nr:hypothetical protein AGMMS50249_1740 [candidate division SR1 bacterium]